MTNQSTNAQNNLSDKERIIQLELRNQELEKKHLQTIQSLQIQNDLIDMRKDLYHYLLEKGKQVHNAITKTQQGNKAAVILTELQFN